MIEKKGKLIVIEGGDGTGKTDQTNLLVDRLKNEGYAVAPKADFPRYGSVPDGHPASYGVRKYLRKPEFGFTEGYGNAPSVNPYAASVMYAQDRFDAAFCLENRPNLWDWINDGYVVISNRYTQSNIGFQASKFNTPEERAKFIEWLYDFEYNILGIPKPDLVILLDLDSVMAQALKSKQRKEQGLALDDHEKDYQISVRARETYLEAARLMPDHWSVVSVGERPRNKGTSLLSGLRSREVVHNMIWSKVEQLLKK